MLHVLNRASALWLSHGALWVFLPRPAEAPGVSDLDPRFYSQGHFISSVIELVILGIWTTPGSVLKFS